VPRDNNSLTKKNIYILNARMVYVLSIIIAAHNISQNERMICQRLGVKHSIIISATEG